MRNIMKAQCEVCGNIYDKAFEIKINDESHIFDSFECAIHALAPTCDNCGVRIIGHGIETNTAYYCCAHCAEQQGVTEAKDNINTS